MPPHVFSESTIDDLMHSAITAVLSSGDRLNPSKGETLDLTGVTMELENPLARLSRSEGRGRLISCLGELCWYLSGKNDTGFIAYYLSQRLDDDEGGAIHGGYGPRFFDGTGGGQIPYAIELLRKSPDSRKAVVQIFDRADVAQTHKDVPCTLTLQFLVRKGELRLIVNMRSNDAYLGVPHDIFAFTMLQEMVARDLGLNLGAYLHHAGSLHVYTRKEARAKAFLDEGFQSSGPTMPPMPTGSPWAGVQELLAVESALREGADPACVRLPADPYWADLGKVLAVFALLNADRTSEAERVISSIDCDAYSLLLVEKTDRARG